MKKLFDTLKTPPLWLLCLTAVCAAGGLVGAGLLLPRAGAAQAWGYVCLSVAGVFFVYTVYGGIRIFPDLNGRVMAWSEGKPFWGRLFREYGFRAIFFAACSFFLNVAFAAYNGAVGILNRSVWFGALAAYYVFLLVLRGSLLAYHAARRKKIRRGQTEEKTRRGDAKVYLICGVFLVLLPAALSVAIAQMVSANEAFVHAGLTIYVYALYAFVKIGVAVYNFVKARKTDEMTVRAAKNISLADAMVSVLALQTAMFREFGTGGVNVPMMNAVTGAAVCALTAALGVFMIAVAAKKIKQSE